VEDGVGAFVGDCVGAFVAGAPVGDPVDVAEAAG